MKTQTEHSGSYWLHEGTNEWPLWYLVILQTVEIPESARTWGLARMAVVCSTNSFMLTTVFWKWKLKGNFKRKILELFCIKYLFCILGVKNGVKGESGASDDELYSDVVSHYSSASESASVVEEGTGLSAKSHSTLVDVKCLPWIRCVNRGLLVHVVSNRRRAGGRADCTGGNGRQTQAVYRQPDGQEVRLFRLQVCLRWLLSVTSSLCRWSAKTRLAGLVSLRQAFSSRLLYDFLSERRLTISDCLERCLKKGETLYRWHTPTENVWICFPEEKKIE